MNARFVPGEKGNRAKNCEHVKSSVVRASYLIQVLCILNLLVTRCTNRFNIQQLYVLPALYLCVL
jgi:hypothetical protein